MKSLLTLLCSLLLIQPLASQANFSEEPGLAEVSAKHARLRAKLRAANRDVEDTAASAAASDSDTFQSVTEQQLNINGSDGCNLSVGNVLIDDTVRNPPNEVNIIIEGDIIQSNNCR